MSPREFDQFLRGEMQDKSDKPLVIEVIDQDANSTSSSLSNIDRETS